MNAYWSLDISDLLQRLRSAESGLSSVEAARRLQYYGPNELRGRRRLSRLRVLWNQFRSPLLLLLVFAAAVSALTGEWLDAVIVLAIVAATAGIGYSREFSAETAAGALLARIQTLTQVFRDARLQTLPIETIVPGDVVQLSAGNLVPADGVIMEAEDCFVSEAVLTGESFPAAKRPGPVPAASQLAARTNCVFLGTNVRSGAARFLVVATGRSTQFGSIAHRLTLRPPETEFDRGVRRFGYFLTTAMLIMVLLVFAAHALHTSFTNHIDVNTLFLYIFFRWQAALKSRRNTHRAGS